MMILLPFATPFLAFSPVLTRTTTWFQAGVQELFDPIFWRLSICGNLGRTEEKTAEMELYAGGEGAYE